MDAARPKVSIVIPNRDGLTPRNGLTYLKMVLPSLREQTFRDFDETVVDDGSSDGSVAYLKEEWPEVRVVSLPGNSGFPAVVNRGIEASTGEYIALLNTDLELSPDWLEGLVTELDRDPKLGFVTGKVVRYGDRGVIEQAGHDYYACGRFSPRGLDAEDVGQFEQPRPSTIVTAAASLYRREAVEAAGGFDEDYFLYCEDGDLCLRILLQGYEGRYVPGPVAFHVRGGTTGQESDLTRFYLLRNVPTTVVKDLPARVLWRALPQIAAYQLNQVMEARQGGFVRTLLRAYASMLRWLPRTLIKRRRVQRGRRISASEFEAHLQTDYPLATRFDRLLRYPGARVN
jgi:GT2 family glycosyltransferase